MTTSVFLSYPSPCLKRQAEFVERVVEVLGQENFTIRTVGVTDAASGAPLKAIRGVMAQVSGLVVIAFRRLLLVQAVARPFTDVPGLESEGLDGSWQTSPYCQIEAAMAYQLGLPVLVGRETGVLAEGMLRPDASCLYLPQIDLEQPMDEIFASNEWRHVFLRWVEQVRYQTTLAACSREHGLRRLRS
jgi:hypothetical protein